MCIVRYLTRERNCDGTVSKFPIRICDIEKVKRGNKAT